jgi:hypothetical protein
MKRIQYFPLQRVTLQEAYWEQDNARNGIMEAMHVLCPDVTGTKGFFLGHVVNASGTISAVKTGAGFGLTISACDSMFNGAANSSTIIPLGTKTLSSTSNIGVLTISDWTALNTLNSPDTASAGWINFFLVPSFSPTMTDAENARYYSNASTNAAGQNVTDKRGNRLVPYVAVGDETGNGTYSLVPSYFLKTFKSRHQPVGPSAFGASTYTSYEGTSGLYTYSRTLSLSADAMWWFAVFYDPSYSGLYSSATFQMIGCKPFITANSIKHGTSSVQGAINGVCVLLSGERRNLEQIDVQIASGTNYCSSGIQFFSTTGKSLSSYAMHENGLAFPSGLLGVKSWERTSP